MKKYLYIYKSELMSNLQYVFNFTSSFITYILFIFTFQSLWRYIYADPSQLINGYGINEMIWYVTITEILVMSIGGRGIVSSISDDIKTGNVAYNINKPFDYIKYQLFNALGKITIKFIIFFILGLIIGYLFIGVYPSINFIELIIFTITCILSLIVNSLILILIGLFSFTIEDSVPIYWVYSKFILVLGVLFPIEFFPKVIETFLSYSPIYAITYGPASLFINFSYLNSLTVVIVQLIYIIVIFMLCQLLFKKGVKKLSVNGG